MGRKCDFGKLRRKPGERVFVPLAGETRMPSASAVSDTESCQGAVWVESVTFFELPRPAG